ncbi:MAG: DUF1638 domain-containing protein [bacterium]|nr:MAG: DUF1638 domain-containing protein [bacterium]
MKKFYVISCHVLWRELCYFASISKNVFNFHFLKQGLHDTPDILRQQVQRAIDKLDGDYSAILIGYGLCSNGLVGIQARGTKLVIMRGHDCITFLLGSKNRYQEYFDRNPGTYWYSPGWIDTNLMPSKERLNLILQEYKEKYGEENAEYLMKMEQHWIDEYSNAAYVDLGFYDTKDYKEYTKKCAKELSWKYDELVGDPQLIINFLEGNWNSEDFLILQPGEKVVASHDEKIIEVKNK